MRIVALLSLTAVTLLAWAAAIDTARGAPMPQGCRPPHSHTVAENRLYRAGRRAAIGTGEARAGDVRFPGRANARGEPLVSRVHAP